MSDADDLDRDLAAAVLNAGTMLDVASAIATYRSRVEADARACGREQALNALIRLGYVALVAQLRGNLESAP